MKSATTRKAALILIDVQNAFLHPAAFGDLAKRSTPKCEENIATLLKQARDYNENLPATRISSSILICHYQQVHPQQFTTSRFNERVWVKNVSSAFVGTGLERFLKDSGVRQLIICGLTTDHCLSTSTRMANNLRIVDVVENGVLVDGGDIILVGDACATFARGGIDAETIHKVNLASLDEEFAHVRETAEAIEKVLIEVPGSDCQTLPNAVNQLGSMLYLYILVYWIFKSPPGRVPT
ncbi:hypothetical protein DSL72_009250 [Monilinia vaccinii-corymbosi]|uniref:Isochorismatase-like domain-containing protein n=1 Tax=Monilinia vaccinii-corymbosi TaxID=61207 RepID=A0A8A3PQT4_9HELO|nr:hypothetical protein DSL72_009250 [Monilinia vaccinii-corymbosi]